ncbi:hypothetical protein [Paenibacillus harenae]|uniref:hypothetical protein n=1 Tax=Paenibacillus harenae TaxID=306543 RepID=UPI0003FE7316|nr:hypothetical protein [Paenibacillus harenae]
MRKWFYIVILMAISGLVGCSTGEEKDIQEIRLECTELCQQLEKPPLQEKVVTDADEIDIFKKAINRAVKMGGELDYGVMFFMHLSYTDGTKQKYALNITREAGQSGLLVDTANSGQGYIIPEDISEALSEIIYGK